MDAISLSRTEAAAIIAATFPGYRGRKIRLEPRRRMTFHGTFWSGGSRNEYVALNLENGRVEPLRTGSSPWTAIAEGVTVDIPMNCAVVEHCLFCGKDLGLRIYVHPDMMPRLLAERAKTISQRVLERS